MADLPKAIFKYVSPERTDILEKLRIRFTQPSRTNDPFEAELCLDLEDEALIAKKAEDKFGEAAAAQVMQEFRKDRQRFRERAAEEVRKIKIWDDMGILSLSATENDLLMWAHYANSHTGLSRSSSTRNIHSFIVQRGPPRGLRNPCRSHLFNKQVAQTQDWAD